MSIADPSAATYRLDRFRLASPQIFETLREMIISLSLVPGTVLSRAELQKKFGTSQTPIRDALMRLEEEGLIEVFPQYATKVSRINLSVAKDALFLRLALEQEAVRRVAESPSDSLINSLLSSISQQIESARIKDFVAFSEADRGFHRKIFDGVGVLHLWELVRRRSGHNDRLHKLHLPLEGRSSQIVEDHERIVDCLRARRPDDAQLAVREHVSRSLANVDEIKSKYQDFVVD